MSKNINADSQLGTISQMLCSGEYTLLGFNCYDDPYIQYINIVKTEIKPYGSFEEALYITCSGGASDREETVIFMPYDRFVLWKDFIEFDIDKSLLMKISDKAYFKDTPQNAEEYILARVNEEPVAAYRKK